MTIGRWVWRLLAGVLGSILAVAFVVQEFNTEALWVALRGADPGFLAVSAAAMLANIALKTWRWRWLFQSEASSLGCRRLVAALMIGQLGNALLPVRMGDAARIGVAAAGQRVPASLVLATIVVEKAIDGVMLLVVVMALLPVVALAPWLSLSRLGMGAGLTLLLAVVVSLVASQGCQRYLQTAVARLPVKPLASCLESALTAVARLQALQNARSQFAIWVASGGIWLLAGLVNHLGFRAVGLELPFPAAMLLAVTEISANSVAYTPVAVGLYHSICILTLSVFGVEPARALPAAVLLHLVVYLPIVLGGAAFSVLDGIAMWDSKSPQSSLAAAGVVRRVPE